MSISINDFDMHIVLMRIWIIVHHGYFTYLLCHWVLGIIKLIEFQHITPSDNAKHLRIRQSQYLIGSKYLSSALPLGMTVLGYHLSYRNGLPNRHGGINLNTHISASV